MPSSSSFCFCDKVRVGIFLDCATFEAAADAIVPVVRAIVDSIMVTATPMYQKEMVVEDRRRHLEIHFR